MHTDVVDLRDFYETRLGQVARHMIRHAIRNMWPDLHGLSLLGLGYATPYLRQFRGEAERVVALMPASQGVIHWPAEGPGAVALSEETELPLPDYSVDRALLVHCLESSEALSALLSEIWRVLTGDGRLLVVAPNRRGIWAQVERTPFGSGHPYSKPQLSKLLRTNMFTPTRSAGALFVPPTRSRTLLRSAAAWERIGTRWFPRFAGVELVEAGKQLYSPGMAPQKTVRRRRPVVVALPQVARRLPRQPVS
ncbi:MAG: methyltransferase domain-containing protein [Kiloniellales bacterium]|jgi:SAM-dependent methyltransferase|nr:methyltransferase domain-containing protein [Kiloniellales bacterium]